MSTDELTENSQDSNHFPKMSGEETKGKEEDTEETAEEMEERIYAIRKKEIGKFLQKTQGRKGSMEQLVVKNRQEDEG